MSVDHNMVRTRDIIIRCIFTDLAAGHFKLRRAYTKKSSAPDSPEGEKKKIMIDRSSSEEHVSNISGQSGFVSAGSIIANAPRNIQVMPELSDEELLQMTIEFEMKHPQ